MLLLIRVYQLPKKTDALWESHLCKFLPWRGAASVLPLKMSLGEDMIVRMNER